MGLGTSYQTAGNKDGVRGSGSEVMVNSLADFTFPNCGFHLFMLRRFGQTGLYI